MNCSYLIGIKGNRNPCGNEGTVQCYYRQNWRIRKQAAQFARMYGHDAVYLLHSYSHAVCGLSPAEFVQHVKHVGKLLFKKGTQP